MRSVCLSTAYRLADDGRVLLGSYISEVAVSGDQIRLTTLMGESITLSGSIRHVDLLNNEILIDPAA